jgi:hypothetical protein
MLSPNELKKLELEETPVVTEEGEEPKEEFSQSTDKREVLLPHNTDVNFTKEKIAEILGENPKEAYKFDKELEEILDYALTKNPKELEDILWEVRYLGNMLGTPGYGENRIKFMYEYVYLLNEGMRINRKLKSMESLNAN